MLPVESVLPELLLALSDPGRAVLVAPPGAGKTTLVPPALLDEPWVQGGRIVMLEPRRLAARAAARRMASLRGEHVGATIGYRVRGDAAVSKLTRIEVVTEGVLLRMLHDDPELDGVAAVILDEFHERSLVADTALALVLGVTSVLRDDLRVLVMSATIDGAAVARLLGDAPVITSDGQSFPVETRFAPPSPGARWDAHLARTIRETLAAQDGSLLAFLPGAGEIHRVAEMLRGTLPADVDLHPLFGAMSPAAQDAAIAPAPAGRRKVVLATNVAETSLTIEGIRIVVDGGLERVPRFSPRTGMSRLETVRITRASADQRRGRAGRTAPGMAIRCWSAADDAGLIAAPRAEILDADLSGLALDLALHGVDANELPWLDPPPAAALTAGRELLARVGALDARGTVTPHGQAMARTGASPRLAHLMLAARERGAATLRRAALIAGVLDERDIVRGDGGPPPVNLELRIEALERSLDATQLGGAAVDRGAASRVRDTAAEWVRRIGSVASDRTEPLSVASLVAIGWPERVARRRGGTGRFVTTGGRGVSVDGRDPLAHAEWLAVAAVDDSGREGRVQLAAPLQDAEVVELVRNADVEEVVEWDDSTEAVRAVRRESLGAIVLAEHPLRAPSPDAMRAALLDGVRRRGLDLLPWSDAVVSLRQRLAFLHHHDASWPDVSDHALLTQLDEWIGSFLSGEKRWRDVPSSRLVDALRARAGWERVAMIDALAPERLTLPRGRSVSVDYTDPAAPVLAVKLQDAFGLTESPRLLGGSVTVTMHLLSPARRPVQVTRDLASFWRTGYFDVRKDLRGRYPKHDWPEDPLEVSPES